MLLVVGVVEIIMVELLVVLPMAAALDIIVDLRHQQLMVMLALAVEEVDVLNQDQEVPVEVD